METRQLTHNGLHRLVLALQSKQKDADGPSEAKIDDTLVLQVIDHKIFDGAQAKKGIKSRLTVSDGTSIMVVIVSEKTFNKIPAETWALSQQAFTIITVPSKIMHMQEASGKKIILLRDKFQVIYTGLKKVIGQPQDYSKASENPAALERSIDITIPVVDTDQGR